MQGVRHLSIEIGPRCNLAKEHLKCPARLRHIDRAMLSTERIVETIRAALDLGFEGYVGFHWYNEPTLYEGRIAEVMEAVPEARYMLWSNGWSDALHGRFEWVNVTQYPDAVFDDRLANYQGEGWGRECWRPLIECAIDYSGRIALCCQDWRMTASPTSIEYTDPKRALTAWYHLAQRVALGKLEEVCGTCKGGRSQAAYLNALREADM